MKYSSFGNTGKKVSRLGMGGMRFEKEIPERDCVSVIRYAHDKGVNYFDTAPVYNEDRSESIYGKAFKEVVMNPLYGGIIPQFRDVITIFPDRPDTVVEDSLLFCLEEPDINIALAGMNKKDMVDFNISVVEKSEIISSEDQLRKEKQISASKPDMCTSCGYCLSHCPEKINIRSYMEIYNHYQLTDSIKEAKEKWKWYHQWGPIFGDDKRPSDCTECLACEDECTQFLNITERLKWIEKHL